MGDALELSILDSGDAMRVIAVARCGFDMAFESLSCAQLKALSDFHIRLSDTAAGRAPVRPTADELKQFGQDLFKLLVRGKIETIYGRLPASHVRLQIYSDRADLQAIPWEYIQQPDVVPGPNALRSIIRVIPTIGLPEPTPRKLGATVRMLFVYAEPPREPSLDWPIIKSTVEAEFKRRLKHLPNFTFDIVEGANTDSFKEAFRDKDYDILHMVCHGVVDKQGVGSLLFQDVKGKATEAISAATLGGFLKNKALGLVVLSACNTSAGNYAKEFATVAKTLVESGIPAVVANQFEIKNSAAAVFAGAFYSKLLDSGDVDQATMEGRISLNFGSDLPGNAARIDWGIPTLYRHLGGAMVFKP